MHVRQALDEQAVRVVVEALATRDIGHSDGAGSFVPVLAVHTLLPEGATGSERHLAGAR